MFIIKDNKKTLKGLLLLSVILSGVIHPRLVHAENRHIRFGMSDASYPPYKMVDKNGAFGIVIDAILSVSKSIGYTLDVHTLPVERLKREIQKGRIDASANALEWRKGTPNSIWSKGIISVADNVVMVKGGKATIAGTRDLQGKVIGLMKGYVYPSLEALIKNGGIKVHRVRDHATLLTAVDLERVEFGILDQNVANWVIRENNLNFKRGLHFISPGFDAVDFRLILFSKKWQPFVDKFNTALPAFKASKEWQDILNRYR